MRPWQRWQRRLKPGTGEDAWRSQPECIAFEPTTPGPVAGPPVRIFLGTQPEQWRGERVFLWSVFEHRDPQRRYEVYRMEGLRGFDRRGWTTRFTNYRFAIPHFAGCTGRAIYNDVDQIYLHDPAALFDLEMGEHGFLALSDQDLSVMLIDCERMAPHWPLEEARRTDKKSIQRATAQRGLRGSLPPEWNARDGEWEDGRSRLVHYTKLSTQPWRPFPDHFAYREGPAAELWKRSEERANAAGFEGFDDGRPSEEMGRLRAEGHLPAPDANDREALRMLARLTPGDRLLELEDAALLRWLLAADPEPMDGILCPGGLEALPETDQAWALRKLFSAARHFLFVAAEPGATTTRFIDRFKSVAGDHEDVHWELFVRGSRSMRHLEGGRFLGPGSPRTWVIVDDRPGNETQAVGLAEALGWSHQVHRLRFGRLGDLHPRLRGATRLGLSRREAAKLHAPWPDLVISAGRRAAPVALWVRARAQGRTRVVHLGRKGGAAAGLFDLAVTPKHARLWPHPSRVETVLPVSRVNDAELARAVDRWKETLEGDPLRPRIGVLVGGETAKFRFGESEARQLGRDLTGLAAKLGGRLWVTTSPRTGSVATEALGGALDAEARFFRWREGGPETPYLGILALCDLLVVTGESESMLAEACATDRPVLVYPLPAAGGGVGLGGRVVDGLLARATTDRPNERGTAAPQRGLARWSARLVDAGLVRPTRDLRRLHEELIRLGRIEFFHDAPRLDAATPHREARGIAARVRRLMGVGDS
ncbi:MAG: hypothetical protein CL910_00035 [Deltaproteobacteria bacterium]|nr:hypothetical protein [Deltaproteobacteria bacterium]